MFMISISNVVSSWFRVLDCKKDSSMKWVGNQIGLSYLATIWCTIHWQLMERVVHLMGLVLRSTIMWLLSIWIIKINFSFVICKGPWPVHLMSIIIIIIRILMVLNKMSFSDKLTNQPTTILIRSTTNN